MKKDFLLIFFKIFLEIQNKALTLQSHSQQVRNFP